MAKVKSGAFPEFDLGFKIGIKGLASTEEEMVTIKDMESFSLAIEGNTQKWSTLDMAGWSRALMTGKGLTISLKGKRNVGDPGNNYVSSITCRGGVFVSLKKFGELRGCIGTIAPVQENLAQEIISNAISAGTRDPRFLPVEEKELPYLEYSVDVLKEAEQIDSLEQLDVRRYGVIVSDEHRRGLLLPDLEGVDTPLQQISIALNKAGMDPDEPFLLERFEVVRHHECRM